MDKCPLDKCLLDKCLLDTPFFDRHEVLVKACVDCDDVIHSMVESRILVQVYKDARRPLSFYFVPLTVMQFYKYKDAPRKSDQRTNCEPITSATLEFVGTLLLAARPTCTYIVSVWTKKNSNVKK